MRGLECDASARAPGGTFFIWASPRWLCGRDLCETRGTDTPPLPSSQLAEPSSQDGVHRGQRSQRIRVSAIGPGGWEGGPVGDENLRSRGLRYGWNENSLCIGPPLDAISLYDLGKSLATTNKVQPQVTGTHARLSIACARPPQPPLHYGMRE